MKKRHFTCILLSLLFVSCNFDTLFNPDWDKAFKDFYDKYTNSAGIEKHYISSEQYRDSSNNLTISSEEDCIITYKMRNPQRYELELGFTMDQLPETISIEDITIEQSEFDTITFTLPVSFLSKADEGHNISSTIQLYNPLNGQRYDDYSVNLMCNSMPPEVNNPTVLNKNGEYFYLAFDMPAATELGLRHKDLTELHINNEVYPITIDENGNFSFNGNSDFTFAYLDDFSAIKNKTFTHTDRSVYFNTHDEFSEADKEYTINLYDEAGFYSQCMASTSITKLNPPVIKLSDSTEISNGANLSVPFIDGKEYNIITIIPPEKDQADNQVSQVSINYKIYQGQGDNASLFASGTSTSRKDIQLPAGQYYIEAGATKTNYEKSAVISANIRIIDQKIYITQGADDGTADGSEKYPFGSISAALDDLKDNIVPELSYSLIISGQLDQDIIIDNSINCAKLTITGKTNSSTDSLRNVAVNSNTPVEISGITVRDDHDPVFYAVNLEDGSIILNNANIEEGGICYQDGSLLITGNTTVDSGIVIRANENNSALKNTITTNSAFTGSALIIPEIYTEGIKVITAEAGTSLNLELLCHFTIQDKDGIAYGLVPSEDGSYATLSQSGTFPELNFGTSGYTMTVDTTSFTQTEVSNGTAKISWYLKDGDTIVANAETALSTLTEACTKLLSNGSLVVEGSTSNGTTPVLTIPDYVPAGTYTAIIKAKIGLYTYQSEISILITE